MSIGDLGREHGPLVFAPGFFAARFAAEFERMRGFFKAFAEAQAKAILSPTIEELLFTKVLLIPWGGPTQWEPTDAGGVFVHSLAKSKRRRRAESLKVPHELGERLEVGRDWVLFDSMALAVNPEARAKTRLAIPLEPGRYLVAHSTRGSQGTLDYEAIRLRSVDGE